MEELAINLVNFIVLLLLSDFYFGFFLATPDCIAASATALATDSTTRLSKAFGIT